MGRGFMHEYSTYDKSQKLAAALDAAIRMCKLTILTFVVATVRFYDPATIEKLEIDPKRLRPIRQLIIENFTSPSLSTLVRTARHCYHLVEDEAPELLRELRSLMAENLVL